MDLIEIANTNKEELLDLWVEGDIQELLLVMLKDCKKEPKPFKKRSYDSICDIGGGYLIIDRDGMDQELILVQKK